MIPTSFHNLLSMKKLGVLLAFASFCALSADAQVTIFSDNLDSLTGNTPGYSFGDAVNFSHTYVASVGVGGSVGARILSDFGGTNGFGGVAYQYQNGNVTGNSSANLPITHCPSTLRLIRLMVVLR